MDKNSPDKVQHSNPLDGTKYQEANIYQGNTLIETCKSFDINEGRLFYLGLMELRPQLNMSGTGDKEFRSIVIPTEDLMSLFGHNHGYYSHMRATAKKLHSRQFAIRDGGEEHTGFHLINIFEEMEFSQKIGGLKIKFTNAMKPFLLELAQGNFTKIAARTIFSLKSMYAIRIVELMLEYQNIRPFKVSGVIKRTFEIDKLRELLGVPADKYPNGGNFIKYVIQYPVEQICQSTRYKVEYKVIKYGRKFSSIEFKMVVPQDERSVESVQELVDYQVKTKQQLTNPYATVDNLDAKIVDVLMKYGVARVTARHLAQDYSEDRIRNNIRYSIRRAHVRNITAYIVTSIKQDYHATKGLNEQQMLFSDEVIDAELAPTVSEKDYIEKMAAFISSDGKRLDITVARNIVQTLRESRHISSTYKRILQELELSPEGIANYISVMEIPASDADVKLIVEKKDSYQHGLQEDRWAQVEKKILENVAKEEIIEAEYQEVEENTGHDGPAQPAEDLADVYQQIWQRMVSKVILKGQKLSKQDIIQAGQAKINLNDLCTAFGLNLSEIIDFG